MLHIYRQITSLRRVRPVVIAQKLENRECFPFRDIHIIRKPTFHFLRRIWFKQIADRPWQISPAEVRGIERALTESNAQLLHIYFGHIAVLLRPLVHRWQKPSLVSFHGADVLVDMEKPAYRRVTEELRELFYEAHICLHPSEIGRYGNQEGVPNSMLEAMASGLPVFATRHGGIPEAVENNVSGILVNERNHRALADVLIETAKSPDRLVAMGRAASDSVVKNFNQTEQTRRLEEIYLREIGQ